MSLCLTDLWRYPVKSCRGEQLAEATVEPWGLAGDRRWMIVDDEGTVVTAREYPALVLVTPRLADGKMTLASPGGPDVTVPVPSGGELVPVSVWQSNLLASLADEAAARMLSGIVGKPVRLVYLDDPTRRATNPDFSQPGDRVSFADGYPLLRASEASLGAVNDWIAEGPRAAEGPLPMRRFRPNVVISGAPAWAEDGWHRVRIGPVSFRVAKGCDRCVLTTVNPDTAAKGHEPLFTLAKHRRWDQKIWFGVNLIPDAPRPGAVLQPGDPVEVLALPPPRAPGAASHPVTRSRRARPRGRSAPGSCCPAGAPRRLTRPLRRPGTRTARCAAAACPGRRPAR
jgi:uncharacterized protein YcbX